MQDHDAKMRTIDHDMQKDKMEAEVRQSGHKRRKEELNNKITPKLDKWEKELAKFEQEQLGKPKPKIVTEEVDPDMVSMDAEIDIAQLPIKDLPAFGNPWDGTDREFRWPRKADLLKLKLTNVPRLRQLVLINCSRCGYWDRLT